MEMLEIDVPEFSITQEEQLLFKLQRILNYELMSASFYMIYFLYTIFLYASIIASIIFTPYLIYVLIKTKKVGWLVFFLFVVVLPVVIAIIVNAATIYTYSFLLLQLGVFYAYCFFLRFAVNDWTREITSKYNLKRQREEARRNSQIFQQRYDNTVN